MCFIIYVICFIFFFVGAKLESFGLWTHCFRSLPDPNDPAERRFFVGCHWIFDPFTKGYDEIKGFLLPCNKNIIHFLIVIVPKLYMFFNTVFLAVYIVATQFFYTITFLGTLLSAVGSSMFLLCCTPEEKRFIQITFALGVTLIVSGKLYFLNLYYNFEKYISTSFFILFSRNMCRNSSVDIRFVCQPSWMDAWP